MALGRIVSALVDARTPFYPNWFYFIVEAVAAAALFAVSLAPTAPDRPGEPRAGKNRAYSSNEAEQCLIDLFVST